jgi:hypothetical protein
MTFVGAVLLARSLAKSKGGCWYVLRVSTGYVVEEWLHLEDNVACTIRA